MEKLRNALQTKLTRINTYYRSILLTLLPMKSSMKNLFRFFTNYLQRFKDLSKAAIQSLLLFFNRIFLSRSDIIEHYAHNSLLELKSEALNENGFIIDQSKLSEWLYGTHNSDYNGCGWIAIYNALIALNWGFREPHPARIINWLEQQPLFKGPIIAGNFGTYPWSAGEFFEGFGYNVKYSVINGYSHAVNNSMTEGYVYMLDGLVIHVPADVHEKVESAEVNIIFYQRNDLTAHFVTFVGTGERNKDGDDVFIFYNDNPKEAQGDKMGIIIATLEEFWEMQKPLWEIIISISNQAG